MIEEREEEKQATGKAKGEKCFHVALDARSAARLEKQQKMNFHLMKITVIFKPRLSRKTMR